MIDVVVTLALVGGAAFFLVWNLTSREHKPACHVVAGKSAGGTDGDAGGGVVLGASLARGLERARSRNAAPVPPPR